MEDKKFPFSSLQMFIGGAVLGFLTLCTIGFFLMVSLYFGGKIPCGSVLAAGDYPEKFSSCLDDGKYANDVAADMNLGASLGVQGTPATFVNGYLVSGAVPYSMMKQVLDALLAGQEPNFDFMKSQETGKIVKVEMPQMPNAVWQGPENAPLTVVEFSDFECPYCFNFYSTMESILSDYGDKIRFTYRHFPLTSIHPNAQKAAEAFECAKEQEKTFEMYDKLFALSASQTMSVENFKKAANELKLK